MGRLVRVVCYIIKYNYDRGYTMAYSNSSLTSVKILTSHHSGQRTHAIDTITIHCMAEYWTAEQCGNWFKEKNCSSNYGIGYDGKIGLYVEEKNVSWCSSNSANDNRAITIEVASTTKSPYSVTSAAYTATIKLVADICIRNGIKKLVWSTNKEDRMKHRNGCNMTVHRDYAPKKSCPGEYLYQRMGDIALKANVMIASGKVSGTTTASTNNKIAWDYLVGQKGWSKTAAAACIGCWLAENGYHYGYTYNNVTPPYKSGSKNPYKYLDKELFPGEIEGYFAGNFPGNNVIMSNPPASLQSYTWNYRPNGVYYSDGYCGIGFGSWTFIYGAGALLQYAKKYNKSWDDLLLQLDFATYWYSSASVEAIDGKSYTLDGNRPSMYAKRKTNFSSVAEATRWFIYYEMPSWYYSGYAPSNYIAEAEKVYKEFKDTAIGSVFAYTNDGSGGIVADPNDVINAEAINGLIISIDPSVKATDIKYEKMTSNHVSGVMFKAGAFFDDKHKVYVYSRNENLDAQVNSAIKAGVRFGLFFDVRAKTVDEAKKECEQLYYAVSKYPPALGLWLHLMFSEKDKKKNNKIMDYYVEEMDQWGLFFGCGIYCTKSELEKIDWDKYQENFYLWYVNRFTSSSELDELTKVLSPEFFVI